MVKLLIRKALNDQLSKELNMPLIYMSDNNTNITDEYMYMTYKNNTISVRVSNNDCFKPHENNIKNVLYVSLNHRKNLQLCLEDVIDVKLNTNGLKPGQVILKSIAINGVRKYNNKLVQTSLEEINRLVATQLKDLIIMPGFYYIIDHPKSKTKFDVSFETYNNQPIYYKDESYGFKIEKIETLSKTVSKRLLVVDSHLQDLGIFKNDFNLEKLGIGGLKKECQELFRRAFCSRTCDPALIKDLDISHCKGVILYGPPGTGKTLIARQLARIMNSHPPKVVNGPEILNKFVGGSEENLRELFRDAEDEFKSKGEFSKLHVIIFDEFDCIARQRSDSGSSGTQVASNVVNQLLSKMDGIESLNNILVIGLTNRFDLIDNALLRPGRFEVHINIGIPEAGDRLEILQIHLKKYIEKNILSKADITLEELVSLTENFTGAEIAGLVRSVSSFAIEREVSKLDDQKKPLMINSEQLELTREDFIQSIKIINQNKSRRDSLIDILVPDLSLEWSEKILNQSSLVRKEIENYLDRTKNEDEEPISSKNYYGQSYKLLITGGKRKGKSTLAVELAKELKITNLIYSSNFDLLGKLDYQKEQYLKKIFQESMVSRESIIIIDDLDQILELGVHKYNLDYSRSLYHCFQTLFSVPINNKLIFIITATSPKDIENIGLDEVFHSKILLD